MPTFSTTAFSTLRSTLNVAARSIAMARVRLDADKRALYLERPELDVHG